jgi:hypothetical protein
MSWKPIISLLLLISVLGIWAQNPGNQITVNTTLSGNQTAPAMAADAQGNHIVVWVSTPQDDGIPGLYARRFDSNGVPVADEFQINNFWAPHDNPAVAMGPLGNFVVVSENYWLEGPVSSAVTARVFNQQGIPLAGEFVVHQYSDGFQGAPAVAMDSLGRFVVVWQSWQDDGDGFGIYARQFDGNGDALGPKFRVNSYTKSDQIQPAVAMESQGDFVVVWTSWGQDGDLSGIFGQRFSRTGESLGQEFRVNFSSLGRQDHPDITKDTLGNFIVCWQRYVLDGEGYAVYARTFDRTAQLKGAEFMVNDPSPDWQVFPSIDSSAQEDFIVAWQHRSEDRIGFDIAARIFDQYGQAQGEVFRVSSAASGRQYTPDIFMQSRSDFSFCWQSRASDEEDWHIAYRAYRGSSALMLEARGGNPKQKNETKKFKRYPGPSPVGSPGTRN